MTARDGVRAANFLCGCVFVIHAETFLVLRPCVHVSAQTGGSLCDLTIRVQCHVCYRCRVAALRPVPTASSLWNARHSRRLPNKVLKKAC